MASAETRLSGEYKVVIDKDGNMFLDDYNNRRVSYDKSLSFLQQVSIFLSSARNNGVDPSRTSLGAYQQSGVKSYHLPYYMGSTKDPSRYPDFFVMLLAPNEPVIDWNVIVGGSRVLMVHDLDKIGLKAILDEVDSTRELDYPVYMNYEDSIIDLHGYSHEKYSPCTRKLDMLKIQGVSNSLKDSGEIILEEYANNNMFYPRLINFEFEFEYSNSNVHFNNFHGFLSSYTVTGGNIVDGYINLKLKPFTGRIEWDQLFNGEEYTLDEYIDITGTGSINEVSTSEPQYRFMVNRAEANESLKILDPSGNLFLEYVVKDADIKPASLLETWRTICTNATSGCNSMFDFSCVQSGSQVVVKVTSNMDDTLNEEYSMLIPWYYNVLDRVTGSSNYRQFRGITSNDTWLMGQPTLLDNVNTIRVNGVYHDITDKFMFDGKTIVRVEPPVVFDGITECEVYQDLMEYTVMLEPVEYLKTNIRLTGFEPYNQDSYVTSLMDAFPSMNQDVLASFNKMKVMANNPFMKPGDTLDTTVDVKDTDIIGSLLLSSGMTSCITPNLLNLDKVFWVSNACTSTGDGDDDLAFNWFLIKGKAPSYVAGDDRAFRYFDNEPLITSDIRFTGDYCETVFLGVKYRLSSEFDGYRFAVYLVPDNPAHEEVTYVAVVDDNARKLYVEVRKYVNFTDLIRGGDVNNASVIDPSFFLASNESFSESNEYVADLKTCSLSLCKEFWKLPVSSYVYFNDVVVRDWKYFFNGKWYVALTRGDLLLDEHDLLNVFPATGDSTFYVYSGNRISVKVTVKGIVALTSDFLWCEDIVIDLYDGGTVYMQDPLSMVQFTTPASNVVEVSDAGQGVFGNYIKKCRLADDPSNTLYDMLLSPTSPSLSLVEQYFHVRKVVTMNNNAPNTITREVFRFPSNVSLGDMTDEEVIAEFDLSGDDLYTPETYITLFDRNQVWNIFRDLFRSELKFKFLSVLQVRKILGNMKLTSMIEYAGSTGINVEGDETRYVGLVPVPCDVNTCVWFGKLLNVYRLSAAYHPYGMVSSIMNIQGDNNIKTLYDLDYITEGVNATGSWEEVQGNVVSSLFTADADIMINLTPDDNIIDAREILGGYLSRDTSAFIINNDNSAYISTIDKNVTRYINMAYASYLLDKFYNLAEILLDGSTRLRFEVSDATNYKFKVTGFNTGDALMLRFTRKI